MRSSKTWCACSKEAWKHGRCIFHQPSTGKTPHALYVTWFRTGLAHGEKFKTEQGKYNAIVLHQILPLIEAVGSWVRDDQWYFVNHFGIIDVGMFVRRECVSYLARILREHGQAFMEIGTLWPKDYGGPNGVALCYKALNLFSKLRVEMVKGGFGLACDGQLMHYFLNQRGLMNEEEALVHLRMAARWAERTMGKPIADAWEWK